MMRNSVIFLSAAFALGLAGAQAMAEESNALTSAGDRSTHTPATPLAMFAPARRKATPILRLRHWVCARNCPPARRL